MKRVVAVLMGLLLIPVLSWAEKEVDRVEEAGTVMSEILNVPDDIPQDLLDKAECVVVLPSVKKLAIGIGGNYGRGVMTCRTGRISMDIGVLPPCMRSKARILASSWADRKPTSSCSS